MDADDCARIIEGVAAVLDLLAADGDVVDDPAPIYELLAERCRHGMCSVPWDFTR